MTLQCLLLDYFRALDVRKLAFFKNDASGSLISWTSISMCQNHSLAEGIA